MTTGEDAELACAEIERLRSVSAARQAGCVVALLSMDLVKA